jgi:putative FmdB family regulatory protein
MPLYEYLCSDCSESFTLLQTVHVQPGETVCPKCGNGRVRRLFSTFAARMQGAGDPASGGGHACPANGCGCA